MATDPDDIVDVELEEAAMAMLEAVASATSDEEAVRAAGFDRSAFDDVKYEMPLWLRRRFSQVLGVPERPEETEHLLDLVRDARREVSAFHLTSEKLVELAEEALAGEHPLALDLYRCARDSLASWHMFFTSTLWIHSGAMMVSPEVWSRTEETLRGDDDLMEALKVRLARALNRYVAGDSQTVQLLPKQAFAFEPHEMEDLMGRLVAVLNVSPREAQPRPMQGYGVTPHRMLTVFLPIDAEATPTSLAAVAGEVDGWARGLVGPESRPLHVEARGRDGALLFGLSWDWNGEGPSLVPANPNDVELRPDADELERSGARQ